MCLFSKIGFRKSIGDALISFYLSSAFLFPTPSLGFFPQTKEKETKHKTQLNQQNQTS